MGRLVVCHNSLSLLTLGTPCDLCVRVLDIVCMFVCSVIGWWDTICGRGIPDAMFVLTLAE